MRSHGPHGPRDATDQARVDLSKASQNFGTVVVAFTALLMGAAASLVPLLCWTQGGGEVVVAGWRLGVGDDDLRWRPWWVVVTSAGGDVEAARRHGGGGAPGRGAPGQGGGGGAAA